MRGPVDSGAASVVAERLLRLLREPVHLGSDRITPSASVGIAIREDGDTVEELLSFADTAMYQAKARGRDQWVCFDHLMRESASDQLRTESALRQAIDNGQLEVHYQPEFHLETGDVVGAEALMRWRHPERGLKAASSFVSLAEQSGLIIDHGRWALGQATAQAARWVAEGCDIITRVNVSARQFRGALVGEVQEALAAANLSAGRLCLEFAETTIMDDAEESVQLLEQLNDLGVKIGIDGFGTGFSSLAYLKRLRLDTLKMDRTIVAGVGVDSENTAIVRSIIGLAQSLDLELVAEGIETDAELAEVVQLGCHRGQGFQLGHPVPAEDFGLLLGAADSLE